MTLSIISENKQIVLLEGDGNYTHIHYSCGRKTLSSYTLGKYEKLFNDFCRVSRKHLVNPKFISEVKVLNSNTMLVLKNGKQVKVPRRRAKAMINS